MRRVEDARAAVAAHPPYLKGHVRHAAALRAALGAGARAVWHALAAADAQKLNKEEALELKRHKALAARRRTAYDKAVAELCASDFDERVEKALAAVPPRAAVVQGGREPALPARCCAIVGACLDWRRASRPVDAIHYARRAKSWRAPAPAPAGRSTPASSRRSFAPASPSDAIDATASTPSTRPLRSLTGGRRIGLGLPRGRAR